VRSALDAKGVLVAGELDRPTGLESRIDEELRGDGELEGCVSILRMGPDGVAASCLLDRIADHVEHANLMLVEREGGLLQIVDVPGDGMKVLSVPLVEFAQRRFLPTRLLDRLRRLHHEVADQDERGLAHRGLHVIADEAADREDPIVPFVGGIEIADDVKKMEFLADFEHDLDP